MEELKVFCCIEEQEDLGDCIFFSLVKDISMFPSESSTMYSTLEFSMGFGGIAFGIVQDSGRVTYSHLILLGTKDLEFEGSDWRRIVSPFGLCFRAFVSKIEAIVS